MIILTFFVLLTSYCLAADPDRMDTDFPSLRPSFANLKISNDSSPNKPLKPEVIRSIFDYYGNKWTSEEIDVLDTKNVIQCLETLAWEGDEDISNIVQDMKSHNILSNENKEFRPLMLSSNPDSETRLKDYLKEQLAQINDRQQAEIMAQETDQRPSYGYYSRNFVRSNPFFLNEPLKPEVFLSILEYPDNQWTPEEIDVLKATEIIQCMKKLIWEGNGDVVLHVQEMIRQGILANNNRGYGPLVLNDEIALKNYLKEQIAKIQDRQQADIIALETDQ